MFALGGIDQIKKKILQAPENYLLMGNTEQV